MAGTGVDADLILSTLSLTLGIATAAMAVVGLVYRLARPMAEAQFGPSRHPTLARPRQLTLEAEEQWVAAAAYRRAAAVAVALTALFVASPWLGGPVDRLADRWRAAAEGQDWAYAVLAGVLWLGLLPLAVLLWALPRRAWARRGLRRKGWATRLGTSTSPGLPNSVAPVDLADAPPYYAALRRASRLRGINAALGAGDGRGEGKSPAPLRAMVLVPAVGGLMLAGFAQIWIAVGAMIAVALGAAVVGVSANRRVLSAPGTTAIDYLILVAAARDGRHGDARARAEAYLTPNPATLQDHVALIAALAGACWIDEPRWDTVPAGSSSDVVVPAALEVIDREGRATRLHVAIRLVPGADGRWRVARVWTEQTALAARGPMRDATPLPVAW
jgi:hypothetical protein